MEEKKHLFLKFIRCKDMVNWSVSHILGGSMMFNEKYQRKSIGSIVYRDMTPIIIQDDCSYKQVTLRTNGGGAVLRDIKQGRNIGTKKQFVVSEGQFIMSKIDARNGAFGIISKELDKAIVTADFPVFNVNEKEVIPAYIALLASTKQFAHFAQSCSRGTTNRQRVDVDMFLATQIPLPTISEQEFLVYKYNETIKRASEMEHEAMQIEQEIDFFMLEELGLLPNDTSNKQEKGKYNFITFVRCKNIEKWGYEFIRKNANKFAFCKYNTKSISQLCSISSGGTPSRNRKDYYNGNIPWIKTGELKNEVILDSEEKITQLGLDNSSAKLYPKGSIVIAMYGATIGKTAKLEINAATNQACAVLFNIDHQQVSTDFLWLYLQSQTNNLKSMAYGGAQPNINAGVVANYKIPIPPLSIQDSIVAQVNAKKEKAKKLKQEAITLRETALKEFENELFESLVSTKNGRV